MKNVDAEIDRILDLAEAVCDDAATKSDCAELDSLVLADETVRRNYWDYCQMHVMLEMDSRLNRALQKVQNQSHFNATELKPWESDALAGMTPPMPTSIPTPPLGFFAGICHNTVGFFSQEIPFAMLIATLITSLGLWAGSLIYVSHHQQVAEADGNAKPRPTVVPSKIEYVGQVTGMIDVHWADESTAALGGAGVPLGRKYAIASGLMEITYDTGAKVILQGPCTYQADSRDSGFLSIGRLTAKLEKKGAEKVARGPWPVASRTKPKSQIAKSQISNSPSLIPNPLLSTAPTFAVRTPTATVTDLGTEFGVEVTHDGIVGTTVFEGMVSLAISANQGGNKEPQVLKAGQTARVLTNGSTSHIAIVVDEGNRFQRSLYVEHSEILIDHKVCNGSFEEPAVGPKNFDPNAGNLAVGVYAKIHDVIPRFWNLTSSIQTKGSFVQGVLGEQYVVLQDPLPSLSIRFDGVEGHPAARNYEPHAIYTLTADFGANIAGIEAVVSFDGVENRARRAVAVRDSNVMQSMLPFELNTDHDPKFIGKPIGVTFKRRNESGQLYVDNVRLKAVRRSVSKNGLENREQMRKP